MEYRVVVTVPRGALVLGNNTLAVEVHDAAPVHTDTRFDALVALVPVMGRGSEDTPLHLALDGLTPCPTAPAPHPDPDMKVLRGPYQQMVGSGRLTIRWRTSQVGKM